jgi:Tat protein translocase TatB subunit
MFNVGGPEVLVILLVALIALGPGQLPEAARKVGKVMNDIRRVSTNFQREITSAFEVEEQKTKEKGRSPGGPTDVSEPIETFEATETTTPDEATPADAPADDAPAP